MALKKDSDLTSDNPKKPSTCESCGEEFMCGAALKSCWCMNIELTDGIRTDLKSKFTSCLCQNCLKKYALNK